MKKKLIITLSIVLVIIIAGGYVGNMFGFFSKGNYGEYSLSEVQNNKNSPLRGKTIIFLGSSVTYGYGSMGVSFADFLEKTDGITAVKEAVSGTTLADLKSNSYVSRMKTIDRDINADAFVCQLSTNDAAKEIPLGEISAGTDMNDFDTSTVAGAIEHIIAYARETWGCPVVFYTQAKYDSEYYDKMVKLLSEIQQKWNITVIDLWNDGEINNITDEERKLYLVDHIHPTKAGYKDWWLPKIQDELQKTIIYES